LALCAEREPTGWRLAEVRRALTSYTALLGREPPAPGSFAIFLRRRRALKPDISVAAATDVLWFYFGYHSYLTLTDENGWTLADAEKWLLGQASSALLP
jgi:hypothetical protein